MGRSGWNAAGQYVVYRKGYPDGIPIDASTSEATGIRQGMVRKFAPYLMLCNAQGIFVPWAPTQGDVLADDWEVV